MKLKGVTITLKTLFSRDIDNHNSLIGGFMGFAHAFISSALMAGAWFLGSNEIIIATWGLTNLF